MEDKRASMVAAAFGSVAIGGFWLARPIAGAAPLRVVEQWTPLVRQSNEADLAVGFRVDNPAPLRAAREAGQSIDYRILDAGGIEVPLFALSDGFSGDGLKLPRGYARPFRSPRLAAYANGELLASAPVAPLPPPEQVPMVSRPHPDIALVFHPGGGIYAEPKRPVARDERWRVFARRTPHNTDLGAVATIAPRPDRYSSRRLAIPYGSDTESVEVDIVRYHLVPRSEIIDVPNLRLGTRMGGTALVVDRRTPIPSALGAKIYVPAQNNGPRRPLRHADPRVAFASIVVLTGKPGEPTPQVPPKNREIGPFLEILSPSPESLGLKELRIGGADRLAESPPVGPVRSGTFTARLKVTFYRPVPVSTVHTVIPVTLGAPVPRPRTFGGLMNSPEF